METSNFMEEWSRAWEYLFIKNAIKENTVYDIDRFFWNGEKLFGQDIYYKDDRPCFDVEQDGRKYRITILWNWENYMLQLMCYTKIDGEVHCSSEIIRFDFLFGLKPECMELAINHAIDGLILKIKNIYG